jgi:uncharacterized cupredoxin-like copper-binding protein
MRIVLLAVIASAITALGVGGEPGESLAFGSAGEAAKVNVKLIEFKLLPSAKKVAPGKVTFTVSNAGQLAHEFVVLSTRTPAAKLPTSAMAAKETGRVGEIARLVPGARKTLTLTLRPGHYALICNLPGHYKAGQLADLSVR